MSDGREERAEQEARREWERERQAKRERAAEYVPGNSGREGEWEPERRES